MRNVPRVLDDIHPGLTMTYMRSTGAVVVEIVNQLITESVVSCYTESGHVCSCSDSFLT